MGDNNKKPKSDKSGPEFFNDKLGENSSHMVDRNEKKDSKGKSKCK